MQETFIPHFNSDSRQNAGKYLTGNSRDHKTNEFLGEAYSIYHTKSGEKILMMGWMFNFTQYARNTVVEPVAYALKEPWFMEAMAVPDIDMIVCTMHIDPNAPPEFEQVYDAVRAHYPTLPFILFTGHRHVLFFEQMDPTAFTLESGKYFEVLGLVEFDLENGQFDNFEYQWMDTTLDVCFN